MAVDGKTSGARDAVWRDTNFLSFWSSVAVSSLADNAYFILLGWFVLHDTGSALELGVTWTAASIPRLVLMLFGGVLADRTSRRLIMILSVSARALVLIAFAAWIATHAAALWVLCTVAVLFGVVDAFFWPASSSIVPQVVPASQLASANSVVQGTQVASMVGGPLLASAVLFFGKFPLMFLILAALYTAAALLLAFLRLRPSADGQDKQAAAIAPEQAATAPEQAATAPERAATAPEQAAIAPEQADAAPSGARIRALASLLQVWRDIRDGIRYSWSIPAIAIMMAASLFINLLFLGPINIGLPVWVHAMDWTGATYSHMEAAFGIGAIAGALLAGASRAMRGYLRYMGWMGSLIGFSMALLGFADSRWTGFLLMAAMGAVLSFINIPIMTFVQTVCDEDKLGRVQSLISLMSIGLVPVSYTLSSFVLQFHLLSLHNLFLFCGILNAAIMAALTFLPAIWRVEENPRWQAADRSGG